MLRGDALGKDIEKEFANLIGSSTWWRVARSIAKGKYMMRFPNAKAVKDWSHFPMLAMRYVNAQMLRLLKVEAYTSSFGAKSTLQQAWFRIWDIPTDQRSIRMFAKVGDLVGKS